MEARFEISRNDVSHFPLRLINRFRISPWLVPTFFCDLFIGTVITMSLSYGLGGTTVALTVVGLCMNPYQLPLDLY